MDGTTLNCHEESRMVEVSRRGVIRNLAVF